MMILVDHSGFLCEPVLQEYGRSMPKAYRGSFVCGAERLSTRQ